MWLVRWYHHQHFRIYNDRMIIYMLYIQTLPDTKSKSLWKSMIGWLLQMKVPFRISVGLFFAIYFQFFLPWMYIFAYLRSFSNFSHDWCSELFSFFHRFWCLTRARFHLGFLPAGLATLWYDKLWGTIERMLRGAGVVVNGLRLVSLQKVIETYLPWREIQVCNLHR